MKRFMINAIAALFLSACAATGKPSGGESHTGMGSAMMPCGCGPEMARDMADMCAKMMAQIDDGGTSSSNEDKKTTMMAGKKSCMMMPASNDSTSNPSGTLSDKPVDPDDHSAHHPPQ